MRIPTLLAVFTFATAGYLPFATADSTPTAQLLDPTPLQACLAKAKGDKLAQIDCCKGHKGICGCRAGKIVCCDNTTSTEPGCTCRGDDGFIE